MKNNYEQNYIYWTFSVGKKLKKSNLSCNKHIVLLSSNFLQEQTVFCGRKKEILFFLVVVLGVNFVWQWVMMNLQCHLPIFRYPLTKTIFCGQCASSFAFSFQQKFWATEFVVSDFSDVLRALINVTSRRWRHTWCHIVTNLVYGERHSQEK